MGAARTTPPVWDPNEFVAEVDWEAQFRLALSGLSWAVGCLDGLKQDTGYAGRVLEQLSAPPRIMPPVEAPS